MVSAARATRVRRGGLWAVWDLHRLRCSPCSHRGWSLGVHGTLNARLPSPLGTSSEPGWGASA